MPSALNIAILNMKNMNHVRKQQSGAALVVGLILLVVLTMMALSSMNTASLDLIMAGNEQYRSRAFHAAEAGIEQAIKNGTFDTSQDFAMGATSTGSGNDTYAYSITRPFNNIPQDPPPMTSTGVFKAAYFTITATGKSERNSTATNTQELFEIVHSSDDESYDKKKCEKTSSIDDDTSKCS